jgi:hypothetical protein
LVAVEPLWFQIQRAPKQKIIINSTSDAKYIKYYSDRSKFKNETSALFFQLVIKDCKRCGNDDFVSLSPQDSPLKKRKKKRETINNNKLIIGKKKKQIYFGSSFKFCGAVSSYSAKSSLAGRRICSLGS